MEVTPTADNVVFTPAPPATAAQKGGGSDEGSHYYTTDPATGAWLPLYTEAKSFTLREARKMANDGQVAVPSVTTYFKVLNKPQLVRWQVEQAAREGVNAGEVLVRGGYPDADTAIEYAVRAAANTNLDAMQLGTRIHKAIEEAVAGNAYDADLDPYVIPALQVRDTLGRDRNPEECMGSLKYGYAGRCDDYGMADMAIIDYKSRKAKGKKVPSHETDPMQLAAYGFAKWGNAFFKHGSGHIIGISTSNPGDVTLHSWTGPELVPAFEAFLALTTTWRYINKFDPRRTK